MDELTIPLALLALVGWVVALAALRAAHRAARGKRAQSARYGNLSEQFAPWMKGWPFDPQGFRFLGKPIDGVQFTDDAVFLVEIKSAGSSLSPEQKRIRELVMAGRVGWMRYHVSESRPGEIVKPWER